MCAGAAMAARIERLVFGAWDPKAGACGSVWDLPRDPLATHNVDVVGGVRAQESAALLVDFFEGRRLG
jgi:tRNA(adenine34) deaminase